MKQKILINADDFGYSEQVNEGIAYCFKKNLVDRTTVMVNMPFVQDAKKIADNMGFLNRVGLHLNLVEGKPLTSKIKNTILCNSDGTFNNETLRKTRYRMRLDSETSCALREEINAQIDMFFSSGFTLRHIDSHQHAHNNLSVLNILDPIIRKKFDSVRLARNIPQEEIQGLKRIYKRCINNRIFKLNKANSTKYFGTYLDVETIIAKEFVSHSIELETHPAWSGSKLIDLYNKECIEEWLIRLGVER